MKKRKFDDVTLYYSIFINLPMHWLPLHAVKPLKTACTKNQTACTKNCQHFTSVWWIFMTVTQTCFYQNVHKNHLLHPGLCSTPYKLLYFFVHGLILLYAFNWLGTLYIIYFVPTRHISISIFAYKTCSKVTINRTKHESGCLTLAQQVMLLLDVITNSKRYIESKNSFLKAKISQFASWLIFSLRKLLLLILHLKMW